MTQMDYAESWLWVHFLLTGDEDARSIIQDELARLIDSGTPTPILPQLQDRIPAFETQLNLHLNNLSK